MWWKNNDLRTTAILKVYLYIITKVLERQRRKFIKYNKVNLQTLERKYSCL